MHYEVTYWQPRVFSGSRWVNHLFVFDRHTTAIPQRAKWWQGLSKGITLVVKLSANLFGLMKWECCFLTWNPDMQDHEWAFGNEKEKHSFNRCLDCSFAWTSMCKLFCICPGNEFITKSNLILSIFKSVSHNRNRLVC